MEPPRRLKDEHGSELAEALLRAGSSYKSPTRTRVRTLIALGLAGSITSVASSASATLLAKSSWLKILAFTALGAAVTLPVVSAVLSENSPPSTASIILPARPSTQAPQAPAAEPEPSLREEASLQPAAVSTGDATNNKAPTSKLRPLGSELATLDAVRVAIAKGDAKRTLALLDGYAEAYPRGRMRVEAEVLRIDAYAKSGQTERARKRALAFLKNQPNSVFAARVQSYLPQK